MLAFCYVMGQRGVKVCDFLSCVSIGRGTGGGERGGGGTNPPHDHANTFRGCCV